MSGWIAQSVEQETENLRVGGSIPSPATTLLKSPNLKHSQKPHKIETIKRILTSTDLKYSYTIL